MQLKRSDLDKVEIGAEIVIAKDYG